MAGGYIHPPAIFFTGGKMQTETGYQPNCSEVVFNLGDMTKGEVLKILKDHGIEEMSYNMYDIDDPEDNEFGKLLADSDNPNLPDLSGGASLRVHKDYSACGYYPGISIVGDQHCQTQLFPTMKKIEEIFPDGEWLGDEGGDTHQYESWLEDDGDPVEPFQLDIRVFSNGLDDAGKEELINYVKAEYGIENCKTDGCELDFGKVPQSMLGIIPGDIGSKNEVICADQIRKEIGQKISEIKEKHERGKVQ